MYQGSLNTQKEGTAKRTTIDRLVKLNPELSRFSEHDKSKKRRNYFTFSDRGSHVVVYVNCNTLIISKNTKANGVPAKAAIDSYVFDKKGDIYPILSTKIDTSTLGWSTEQRNLFRGLREIAEGRDFGGCGYLTPLPDGSLYVRANGSSCTLPYSYEDKTIAEMFVYREKLIGAMRHLRKKAGDVRTTSAERQKIHLTLLVLESNYGNLYMHYTDPKKSGKWTR